MSNIYYYPAYAFRSYISADILVNEIKNTNNRITLYSDYNMCLDVISNSYQGDGDNCGVLTVEYLGNDKYSIRGGVTIYSIIIEDKDLVNRLNINLKKKTFLYSLIKIIKYRRIVRKDLRSVIRNVRKEYKEDFKNMVKREFEK